jgi:NAD(P)-dependent dehydrogenase (short-subunit alcohol dehydrogenase family)
MVEDDDVERSLADAVQDRPGEHGMDLELTGKRALVTGGSRGIGLAIARQLAREGARVVLAARDQERLDTAAAALAAETGADVHGFSVDTGEDASVKALIGETVARLGGLDILVNNAAMPAGQSAPPKLAGTTDAVFWDDVNIKVMGYLRCAREAAPYMAAQGWGRIINISGLNARIGSSIVGAVRNVGVAALTKTLADELGGSGINVTVVHPGLTRTEKTADVVAARAEAMGQTVEEVERRMVIIGRVVEAEEVAYVVAFLASPKSVAVTGDAIACGGGWRGAIYY